jgi:phospholipid/cholesterol/gamma-HCH transport system permease protein
MKMLIFMRNIGFLTVLSLQHIGEAFIFLLQTITRAPWYRGIVRDIYKQMYVLGVQSLGIIGVSAVFIGLVLGLQGYHTLQKFGAQSQLGPMIALSILREMGPVISALLFSGRACSALTAEIGLLKASDQLASMQMMGIDPVKRIIMPRFWAGFVGLPLLNLLFCAMAIFAGYWYATHHLMLDAGTFWSNTQAAVSWKLDIKNGMIKSFVFAMLLLWIALYQGLRCIPTANGISQATTKTVVLGALCVLGSDFILTALMIGDW